jgi:hypothetical protein
MEMQGRMASPFPRDNLEKMQGAFPDSSMSRTTTSVVSQNFKFSTKANRVPAGGRMLIHGRLTKAALESRMEWTVLVVPSTLNTVLVKLVVWLG